MCCFRLLSFHFSKCIFSFMELELRFYSIVSVASCCSSLFFWRFPLTRGCASVKNRIGTISPVPPSGAYYNGNLPEQVSWC